MKINFTKNISMKLKLILSATALSLGGCGGGGGGGGGGSAGYTHSEVAQQFVTQLNASGLYDVSLAKTHTLRTDFIVIYDYDLDEYDAVYIGDYTPGMNAVSYLESYSTPVYFDLDVLPGHYEYEYYDYYDSYCGCYLTDTRSTWVPTRYRDYATGYVFEKIASSGKDLEKFAALAEEKVVNKRAQDVAAKFGLSVERGKEVVRLAMAWQKAGGKNLTERDQDAFSEEVLGFSITEAKAAAQEHAAGNKIPLEKLVEKAAETNSTSPENVRQIISEYFGQI